MDVRRIENTGVNSVKKTGQVATESVAFAEVMSKRRENVVYERMTKLVQDIEIKARSFQNPGRLKISGNINNSSNHLWKML